MTIKEIKTDQDAFEFVEEFLMDQHEKSSMDDDNCAYRGFRASTIQKVAEECLDLCEGDEENPLYELTFINKMSSLQTDAKCAIGCLISDEYYDKSIEGFDAYCGEVIESVQKSNSKWNITEHSEKMLRILQSIHDNTSVGGWAKRFETMRGDFDHNGEYCGV